MENMKKVLLFVSAVQLFILTLGSEDSWTQHKLKHNKNYPFQEDRMRYKAFVNHTQLVDFHNELYRDGKVLYTMKLNRFADMTKTEFLDMHCYKYAWIYFWMKVFNLKKKKKIPDEINWVKKGAVTDVKDQGTCASCWAFTATGALEGQYFLKKKKLVSLSEQNLIDCASEKEYWNHGCSLGDPFSAFIYVEKNGGINTEKTYPYEALNGSCRFNSEKRVAKIKKNFRKVHGTELTLKEAVATIGPIAASIDGNHKSFFFYEQGIYEEPECHRAKPTHSILIVGYGTENGHDYWLIKNSWGKDWGMNGYMKLARNKKNMCGITYVAGYPIL